MTIQICYISHETYCKRNHLRETNKVTMKNVTLLAHRSDFCEAPAILTGIVLSSVLMHKNSPVTHMVVTQTRLMHHQVADRGSPVL